MKLSLILESVQDQIQALAAKHRQDPNTIIDTCKKIGGKYWKWVLKQWYSENIILPEDGHRVQEALQNFQKAYHRLPPNQKDINKYKRVSDLEAAVESLLGISSSTKSHDIDLPGVEVVSQQGPYTTIKVSDPESLMELGEGTKWCTKGSYPNCKAEESIEDHEHIFIILQNSRPVIQYTPDYNDVKDFNNREIDDPRLLNLIPEPSLDDDPDILYSYVINVRRSRWPEAEPIIMQDPASACVYAVNVRRGRWPEAEPIIIRNPTVACYYATKIKGRWPEAEPIIMKNPDSAFDYALNVIKGRWPEAEPYIKRIKTLWGQYTRFLQTLRT